MKPLIFFLEVFLLTTFSNYPQSRTKETDSQTGNNNGRKQELNKTDPEPALQPNITDIRNTPHDPPTRPPINTTTNPIRPISRPVSPPPVTSYSPDPTYIIYVPAPIYNDPPVVEPVLPYSSETTNAYVLDINYETLGLSQFKEKDYYNALESFELALETNSLNYTLYYYLGTTEIEVERYDEAINDLTKFIDNVIENRLGYYERGLAYFYSGNRDAAFDDLVIADQYQVDEAKVILKQFYDYY
jgi:tetratricopeptide (TPR) repeat protein